MASIINISEWFKTNHIFNKVSRPVKAAKRIPYSRIAKRVQDALSNNKDEIGRRILLPNVFTIYFNPEDRHARESVEDILINELKEELALWSKEYCDGNRPMSPDIFTVNLESGGEVPIGDCYVDCSFRAPDEMSEKENLKSVATLRDNIFKNPVFGNPLHGKNLISKNKINTVFTPLLSPQDDANCRSWTPWKSDKQRCLVRITGPGVSDVRNMPDGRWNIGRSQSCEIILKSPDKKISRRHIEVETSENEVRIRKVGINKVLLNEAELLSGKWKIISPGDLMVVGPYKIKWSMMRLAQ